ncbi:endoplasmic reticulum-Golgi intermediate compartment protein 1-like [Saccoglossus kowalevskii]|uniref:Endoplasmic reticulum-Golgi intermediate compartment protein 1-like n=1 Tax=Saccoglossus kowalevskii TaxID=10224 RepID=A0ABM0N132_SACKO|nr:PREDICTED: endoplasmic reticulum-Golgi intermediate compartment protein 1-like [Saccoglossus kowalevskii]
MPFDVRRFDVYRKIPKDLTQPTLAGAMVSICSALFIVFLLLSEFTSFIAPDVRSELYVDNPGHIEKLNVKLNISLPRLKCEFIGLDIQDDMGRHEVGLVDNTNKIPLNNNAGCRFEAYFKINKVPGNFHVSTHAAGSRQPQKADFVHTIHEIIIGDDIQNKSINAAFNPLAGYDRSDAAAESSHDYYMKVVPTVYEDVWGRVNLSYQYTYAYKDYVSYGHGHRVMPAIWFRYDISPITVKYHEKRAPFYTFITTICAIVGGTFTVAGIIDSMIYSASEVFKKAEIGKLS